MEGVYTAIVTPFEESGEIDKEAYQRLIKRQEEAGIKGVVIAGTTGEGWSLTASELELLFNLTKENFSGQVVVGTGAISTKKTIEKTAAAKRFGADAALVIVPFYNLPSEEGVIEHYKEVANVGLPVIAYHHPTRTSVKLSVGCLEKICDIPGVIALKDSSSDENILRMLSAKTNLFSGNDPEMKWAKAQGAGGIISVISNLFPQEVIEFFSDEISDENWLYNGVLKNLYLESNPTGIKAALKKAGLCLDRVRMPLKPYSDWAKEELYKAIQLSFHKEIANN
ncbi:MAG: 4-hydroxy-tetrahydrodipicolinate synthase [Chlamydiia bacterium]|nr:4-hydroxy-tetrahydrodipicolinate synthase [Chlamydiia bacterium]